MLNKSNKKVSLAKGDDPPKKSHKLKKMRLRINKLKKEKEEGRKQKLKNNCKL